MKTFSVQTLSKTTGYLKEFSSEFRDANFPLDKIDTGVLEGIQNGIPVLEGVSLKELRLLAKNFEILNIARGCQNDCFHCLRDAQKPLKTNSTILWDDFKNAVGGFEKLNERLGFNIFQGNSHAVLFDDFNPPHLTIKRF